MEARTNEMQPGVALFIDWDNIAIPSRDDFDLEPSAKTLMKFAKRYGRVLVARAYANWQHGRNVSRSEDLFREGITPVFAPNREQEGGKIKNSADVLLAIDCCQIAFANPLIRTVVIASGDGYVAHLIGEARKLDKRVVVLSVNSGASALVSYLADEFVAYESLLAGYVQQAATRLKASQQKERRQALREAFAAVSWAIRELRTPNSDSSYPEHDAVVFKKALRSAIPDFEEERLGFERFRHFLFTAELQDLIRVDTRGEHPVIYGPTEEKTDNGKPLPAASDWKKIMTVLGGGKKEQEAVEQLGEELLRTARDNHFIRQKEDRCFPNPYDERVAVYRMALKHRQQQAPK